MSANEFYTNHMTTFLCHVTTSFGHHVISFLQPTVQNSNGGFTTLVILIVIKVDKLFSFFSSRCFLKLIETSPLCFFRVIETQVKVWENWKKLWKYSHVGNGLVPMALVPTAFLVLPNFHLCFY